MISCACFVHILVACIKLRSYLYIVKNRLLAHSLKRQNTKRLTLQQLTHAEHGFELLLHGTVDLREVFSQKKNLSLYK